MALVPGYVPLTDTESITWAKLLKMFTKGSATIANQSQIVPGVITVATSAPSGKTGDGWFDVSRGSGYGELRIFDGSDWKSVGSGFIAQNKTGLQLNVGECVRIDSSITTELPGSRVAVVRTTAQTQFPLGVVGSQMNNDEIGLVITRGKVKAMKDGEAITSGQPMAPSATAAQWTTNAIGSWGNPFGSGTAGMWLEDSAAAAGTLVSAMLFGPTMATWVAYKSTPNRILNAVDVSALATWQTAVSWDDSPAGTIAHLIQVMVRASGAGTNVSSVVGFRPNGSSLSITDGVPFLGGPITEGADDARGLFGQLWVPMGADNTFQYYFDSDAGGITITEVDITVWEVAAMVGGQVV